MTTPLPAPDSPIGAAVRQVVADVRSTWPDAGAVEAVTFALETVGVGDLDKEDPYYLAYLVLLTSTPGVARGFAQRQQWQEEADQAAKFADGDEVLVFATNTMGLVQGKAYQSREGWYVTVKLPTETCDHRVCDLVRVG